MDTTIRSRLPDGRLPTPVANLAHGRGRTVYLYRPETFIASAPHRFTARAPRAVSKHAEQLWADALKQVDEGWLTPPEPLDENGRFLDRPRGVVISLLDSESNKPTNCEGATI